MANFKQYDTRWSNLPYPVRPHIIRDCGCGEVAIANTITEMVKYRNETPKTIQPYCKQFAASNGDGTAWAAIPVMMKHYGMTEVMEHATMAPLWKELNKGGRVAILLMNNRLAGSHRVKWTGSKHFIAITKYKYENGLHKVYVKDSNSGSSSRNGWLSYEEDLRNAVHCVWSGKLAGAKAHPPTTPYTGKLPTKDVKKGSKGIDVKRVQIFLNWRFGGYPLAKLAVDGICGDETVSRIKRFQRLYEKKYGLKVDGVFGAVSRKAAAAVVAAYEPDPLKPWYEAMATQYEWSKNQKYNFVTPTVASSKSNGTCITFVAVALQRLGLLPSGKYFYLYPKTMRIAGNGASYALSHTELFTVWYPNKTVSQMGASLHKGDICGFGNPAYHTMVYMGKNASGQPLWNTMGHKRGLSVTYPYYANRKINMIVRLKKTSK